MYKLCMWMDVPSHYQSAFFRALERREDLDLQVCYTKGISGKRAAQGWKSNYDYEAYEHSFDGKIVPEKDLEIIPEWRERTHVVSSYISRGLVDYFCRENIRWIHWSEMPGIRLAKLLNFRMELYRILNPMMLMLKRHDARCMKNAAAGVLGQGVLAAKAFRLMGVPEKKLGNLYYVPEALEPLSPSTQVYEFSAGRRVFLSVGALCRRKGIDVLLKAFARTKTKDWCLVFCGLDRENGDFQRLTEKLGLSDCVLFMGAYPVERIAEVYAASDVFVLSSRFDGWGAVLNEAASLGMPLIGTDLCGGSWHLIEDGKNGWRVRAGTVPPLVKAMKAMIDHPENILEFGRVSKELYFSEFTPDRNAERLAGHLKRLLGNEHA